MDELRFVPGHEPPNWVVGRRVPALTHPWLTIRIDPMGIVPDAPCGDYALYARTPDGLYARVARPPPPDLLQRYTERGDRLLLWSDAAADWVPCPAPGP